MTHLPEGDWLTLTEAAKLIGRSQARLSQLVKAGQIEHHRIGRQIMILKHVALAFRDAPRKHGRPRKEEPPAPPKKKRK